MEFSPKPRTLLVNIPYISVLPPIYDWASLCCRFCHYAKIWKFAYIQHVNYPPSEQGPATYTQWFINSLHHVLWYVILIFRRPNNFDANDTVLQFILFQGSVFYRNNIASHWSDSNNISLLHKWISHTHTHLEQTQLKIFCPYLLAYNA